jgi:hypothetical protein
MNSIKKVAMGLAFTTIGFAANAQKNITEGLITYNVSTNGQQQETKNYFKGDSSSYQLQQGPAAIKILTNAKTDYLAFLIDVPVASMKKAAVATPADIEQMKDQEPKFTATQTTETQTIAGFKCKKVQVKDSKNGSNFDVWVTSDVTAPTNSLTKYFVNLGGFPIKFTTIQMGKPLEVTVKSISEEKVKAGTFTIPAGFDRITFEDLKALGGGRG